MRILIYEYITGGGLLSEDADCLQALLPEGEAMLAALSEAFAAVRGTYVHVLRDARLPEATTRVADVHLVHRAPDELPTLRKLTTDADWTVLIAPEIDGVLLQRTRLVEQSGGRLLSPSAQVVDLCADKLRTAVHLRKARVAVPPSIRVKAVGGLADLPTTFRYPAVLKRIDGAGSVGLRPVENAGSRFRVNSGKWMLETFMPGLPASTAVLCGPNGHVVLPPFVQHIEDETFRYLGGSRLMDPALSLRARRLATSVVHALPEPQGYLGIDMVLGADASGKDDAVIEVNPRPTTSLVGLCAIARTNVAEAMLAVARGKPIALEWSDDPVSFSADGTVNRG